MLLHSRVAAVAAFLVTQLVALEAAGFEEEVGAPEAATCSGATGPEGEEAPRGGSGSGSCHLQQQAVLRSLALVDATGGSGNDRERMTGSDRHVKRNATWGIIGLGGVKYSDVTQGELGSCYFLAAIASMAYFHPEVIEAMFVRRELWTASRPVYVSMWHLSGEPTGVAVDDRVPVEPGTGRPVFVRNNNRSVFWPLVLEKAWAKIFGSFKRVDGGTMSMVYKAMTQAPVDILHHDEALDKALLWSLLENATSVRRFPTGAESRDNAVNIPSRLAYVVFNVTEMPSYGKVVYLYAPWTEDLYRGSIPNTSPDDGAFYMSFDEYIAAFAKTTIARVTEGHVATSKLLSTQAQRTVVALEFEIEDSEPFSVQAEWPHPRLLPGCMVLAPKVTMVVAKWQDWTRKVVARRRSSELPVSRADLPGGAGRYSVFIAATFPNGPWMEELTLNVYAAGPVEIQTSKVDPIGLFLEMHGMCDVVQVKGLGAFEKRSDELVGGLPSFWQRKQGNASVSGFMQKVVYWDPEVHEEYMGKRITRGDNKWKIALSMSSARSRITYNASFDATTDISCDEELSNRSSRSSREDDEVAEEVQASQNLMHGLALRELRALRARGRRADDACARAVDRLGGLDNAEEISNSSDDSLFPAAQSSIGTESDVCGDASAIAFVPCVKSVRWDTFQQIAESKGTQRTNSTQNEALMKRCITSTPMAQMCLVKNSCPRNVEMVCASESGIAGRKTLVHHRMELPALGSSFADLVFCSCGGGNK